MKILCIEDDQEIAALIAEDLSDRGFDVSIVHGGPPALAAIQMEQPDLVLADVATPAGRELHVRLTALAPALGTLPFIFLTAPTEEENLINGLTLGTNECVTKPIDFDRLGALIIARLTHATAV